MPLYPDPVSSLVQALTAGYQQGAARRQQQQQQGLEQQRWQAQMGLQERELAANQAYRDASLAFQRQQLGQDWQGLQERLKADRDTAEASRQLQLQMNTTPAGVLESMTGRPITMPAQMPQIAPQAPGGRSGLMPRMLPPATVPVPAAPDMPINNTVALQAMRAADEANQRIPLPDDLAQFIGMTPGTPVSREVLGTLYNAWFERSRQNAEYGTPESLGAFARALAAGYSGLPERDPQRLAAEGLGGTGISLPLMTRLIQMVPSALDVAQGAKLRQDIDFDRRFVPLERHTALGARKADVDYTRERTRLLPREFDIRAAESAYGMQPQVQLEGEGGWARGTPGSLGLQPLPPVLAGRNREGGQPPVLPPSPGAPDPPGGPEPDKWRRFIGPPKTGRAATTVQDKAAAQRRKDVQTQYNEIGKQVVYDQKETESSTFTGPDKNKERYVRDVNGVRRMVRAGATKEDVGRFEQARDGVLAERYPWYRDAVTTLKRHHESKGLDVAVGELGKKGLGASQILTVLQSTGAQLPTEINEMAKWAYQYSGKRLHFGDAVDLAWQFYAEVGEQQLSPARAHEAVKRRLRAELTRK